MKKEIKVKVQFTDGYKERYTKACLEQLRKREKNKEMKDVDYEFAKGYVS